MRAVSMLCPFPYDTGDVQSDSIDVTLIGETLMFKTRFAISWMMALSLLLLGTVAAQDSGQYLILSAQYGKRAQPCGRH